MQAGREAPQKESMQVWGRLCFSSTLGGLPEPDHVRTQLARSQGSRWGHSSSIGQCEGGC